VPEAKNVAYTHQYLGLHMDLLYMANPPGLQLLHCLKNTCEGGSSLFVDAFQAACQLGKNDFLQLCDARLAYQYKNAGEHYYFSHPVIETDRYFVDTHLGMRRAITHVNYSPPFQADHVSTADHQHYPFPQILRSLRKFARYVESPENLYEYKMQEGECVIFNNRRVLHGRREFDAQGGERWLKGAYVDTDVFMSRWRVLNEKYKKQGDKIYQRLVEKELNKGILVKKEKTIDYTPRYKKKVQKKLDPPIGIKL
jgi:alpha-ketoglutarate-dependent taurine dioxygenase